MPAVHCASFAFSKTAQCFRRLPLLMCQKRGRRQPTQHGSLSRQAPFEAKRKARVRRRNKSHGRFEAVEDHATWMAGAHDSPHGTTFATSRQQQSTGTPTKPSTSLVSNFEPSASHHCHLGCRYFLGQQHLTQPTYTIIYQSCDGPICKKTLRCACLILHFPLHVFHLYLWLRIHVYPSHG